jgi:hypothetical protein
MAAVAITKGSLSPVVKKMKAEKGEGITAKIFRRGGAKAASGVSRLLGGDNARHHEAVEGDEGDAAARHRDLLPHGRAPLPRYG